MILERSSRSRRRDVPAIARGTSSRRRAAVEASAAPLLLEAVVALTRPHPARRWVALGVLASLQLMSGVTQAVDTSPAQELGRFAAQAGASGSAERGAVFFNTRHGGEWSCASCHGEPPVSRGKHARTGKTLAPLAPAFNAQAFTRSTRVEKWFRRNCKDVAGRECTAGEKADVMAYLLGLGR